MNFIICFLMIINLNFLITGDLMNSPNRKNMYAASHFMNRLKRKYHSDVTFVLGNHDVIVYGLNIFKKTKDKSGSLFARRKY